MQGGNMVTISCYSCLHPARRVMVYVHPEDTCSQDLVVGTWRLQTQQRSLVGNTVQILGFPNLPGVAAMLCFICDITSFGFVTLRQGRSISRFIMTYQFTLSNETSTWNPFAPTPDTHTQSHFSKLGNKRRERIWKDFGERVQFSWHSSGLSTNFIKHSAGLTGIVRLFAYNVH